MMDDAFLEERKSGSVELLSTLAGKARKSLSG